MQQKDKAKKYWSELGDIPVNENDDLDADFTIDEYGITFEKGTDKFDVYYWFEEKFDLSVAEDLMNL